MSKDIVTISLSEPDSDWETFNITSSMSISLPDVNMGTVSVGSVALDTITISDGADLTGMNMDWLEQYSVYEEYKEEKEIRERNEGVQKAWEQYKIMVALAKNPPEPLE